MSAPLRPLPARPSLAFERKEAKALLRRLRAGDPDALARARARHPAIDPSAPERVRLADAQLVLAREYGFASWPRLVRYFGDVERQRHGNAQIHGQPEFYEASAREWLSAHRERRARVALRALAAYVPRFYGMRVEDVAAATVTEDDVRLAMARQHGCPSWDVLLERATAAAAQRRTSGEWDVQPMERAARAIAAADLGALRRAVEAQPELLHPTDDDVRVGRTLLRSALHHERRQGREALRGIMEWLAAQGHDVQTELNRQLCGHLHMKPEKVRWLLDRGADPNWVAPNGIPVLEHALIRYWNGEAVDVLAARATPRPALWIAAGLDDVDGVRHFLDRDGRPTAAARRLRPDFTAVGPPSIPSLPDPDDEDLLMEAFWVAVLNGRTAVMEYMVSRGFPVDSLAWSEPVINIAVGNAWTPAVDCLVRCGADLDLKGWRPQHSAREIAREMLEHMPHDAQRRRIAELCGLDPDAILAERDARPVPPPHVEPKLREALDLAADDAFRLGQSAVGPENLLFGLLRGGGLPLQYFTRVSRMDRERFHADAADRLRLAQDRLERTELPLRTEAQAAVQAANTAATERRRQLVQGLHLLYALLRAEDGAAAGLLARYGGSAATVVAELEKAM